MPSSSSSQKHRPLLVTVGLLTVALIVFIVSNLPRPTDPQGAPTASAGTETTTVTSNTAAPFAAATSVAPAPATPIAPTETAAQVTNTLEPVPLTENPWPEGTPIPLPVDKIGILVQVTDANNPGSRGGKIFQAIKFAFDELSTRAELANLRGKIELIPFDDQDNPALAAARVASYANQESIVCVLGVNRSQLLQETLRVYDTAGLAALTVGATNSILTDATAYPHHVLHRMVGTNEAHAKFAANVIENFFATKQNIHIIYVDNDYGRELAQSFSQSFVISSTQSMISSAPSTDDLQTAVEQIPPNTNLIYFAGYYEQAVPLFPLIQDKLKAVTFFASDGVDDEVMKSLSPELLANLYYTAIAAPVGSKVFKEAETSALANRYNVWVGGQRLSSQDLPPYLVESYDSASLCLTAIAQVSVDNNGALPNQEQVRAKIATLTQSSADGKDLFPNVGGEYIHNDDGDLQNPVYFVRRAGSPRWSENEILYKGDREGRIEQVAGN